MILKAGIVAAVGSTVVVLVATIYVLAWSPPEAPVAFVPKAYEEEVVVAPTPAPEQPEGERNPPPNPQPMPAPSEEEVSKQSQAHRDVPRDAEAPSGGMTLSIPALDVRDLPVIESTEPGAIDRGVVHDAKTSLPNERDKQKNVFLAGHRLGWPGTASRLAFWRLPELSEGDEVILRNNEAEYTYRVAERFGVLPAGTWVKGEVEGRDILTLMTCTGPNYSQRLIVRADKREERR